MVKNKQAILIVILSAFISFYAFSQEKTEPLKPVEMKWSGFIMNNLFFDSRKNFDAVDGLLVLFPMPRDRVNAHGKDLNAVPNLNFVSFAARLRTSISGPVTFGAATDGLIEFDFTSRGTNSGGVRFRHAWMRFDWDNTELLVGRTWHPLVSAEVTPTVNALSWGAPFQPFNRSDQVTVTRRLNIFSISGSLLFQNDYALNGPSGKSFYYQTNTLIPNLHMQVKYYSGPITSGLGADYKRILPATHTTSPLDGLKYTTNESFDSYAFLAYGRFKKGNLTISSKTIFAANISESLMAGAFGISALDSLTGRKEYVPYHHWFLWGSVMYGAKLQAGVFGGYFKNLGTVKNLVPGSAVYGLGENISEMYRITPMVSYTSGRVVIAAENEYNVANYGRIDHSDKGRIKDTEEILGVRFLLTMYYFF